MERKAMSNNVISENYSPLPGMYSNNYYPDSATNNLGGNDTFKTEEDEKRSKFSSIQAQ